MTAAGPPCDQDVRDRVTRELGTTFLLEAGAGTGKTRVLVDRYVACVLDAERGAGDVGRVAAITFTEKAAGELRQRVREEFEARAAAAPPASAEAGAIERALAALDDAPIGTIHGFAARLLREFPVAARVDPAFEQLDALGSEIERSRLWEQWLAELAAGTSDDRPERAWLSRLLRAGVRLDAVRALAVGPGGVLDERYDLDPVLAPPPPPDLGAGLDALAQPVTDLRDFCTAACRDQSDNGFVAATTAVEACERLLSARPDDLDRVAAGLYDLPLSAAASAPGGAMGHWDAALGGKDGLRARYQALRGIVDDLRDAYASYVTGLAAAVAGAYARWAGDEQLANGLLDFTDLLGRLRDLLATDRAARGALHRRFSYILVDEFQDTDPLQAQIVFYLCERRPVAESWRDVELEPGKLYLVGDPKQSIYRFRRADIALYDEVKALVARQPSRSGVVERISQNFRTTPALLDWVNDAFAAVFDDAAEGRQPPYEPVAAYRPSAEGARVAVLRGPRYDSRAAGGTQAARRDEARALAALLVEMHDAGRDRWRIQDRDSRAGTEGAAGESEPRRRVRWGDIALLFRATTGLETYEQALREAGVPYRVEGGATYFVRREVADALLCLRAANDPSDGAAVYGALHSTYFGFSDDDLVLFWVAGGRFDPFAAGQPEGHEKVTAALTTLRTLHERRAVLEPHEMVAALTCMTRAEECLAASGPGSEQAVANLDKLVERARAFTDAGGGGLADFLAWAAQAGEAAGEQESYVDDDGDVVRLSTIHKAKGLEFPVVVLAGGALSGGGGGGEPVRAIVDRSSRRLAVKLKAELPGAAPRDLRPALFTQLQEREKAMAASELRRLLYVAATRARDRLVISWFGQVATRDGKAAAVLLGPLSDALSACDADDGSAATPGVEVLVPGEPAARPIKGRSRDGNESSRKREAWLDERRALLTRAARPAPATSPSALEHVDEELRDRPTDAGLGRARALALGSAVHRVLELCDLAEASSIGSLAAAATRELGRADLAAPTVALAGACWRSAPVRAAAMSSEAYREVPVGALVGDTVVSGSVDLLYRDGDEWVIVDYKTDAVAEAGVLRERYEPQGAAYALAVEAATGSRVREVVLVAAAIDGEAVSIRVDDGLRARARADVAAAAEAGRAVGDGLERPGPGVKGGRSARRR